MGVFSSFTYLEFKETARNKTACHSASKEIEGHPVVTGKQFHATGFDVSSRCTDHRADGQRTEIDLI